jgi:hypothetical protein
MIVIQFIVAIFFVYGLLFAKTPLQSYIVLIGLVLLFLFKRYVQEKGQGDCQLTELLKEFCLLPLLPLPQQQDSKDSSSEELILGTAVLIAIARTAIITLNLEDVVF